jgi:hypothetical protein
MSPSYEKGVPLAILGFALAAVLSLAAPAFAGEETAARQSPGAGLQAAVDPATGKLRQPTAAETQALAAGIQSMFKRSASGLQVRQTPDGTMFINLGTSFLNVSVAQVGPDGLIHQSCVGNPVDAKSLFNVTAHVYEEK